MPGFQISDHQIGQKALPSKVVYIYTWELENLIETGTRPLYLKDISLPSYSFDTEAIKTGHAQYQFAKGIKWSDVKLTFYDVAGWGDKLQELSNKIWSPEKGIQLANDYMGESTIKVFYYDNVLAYTWKLINSWIKSVSFSKLTYESSGVNNVNVTLAYAWAEITHA